jgi:class II lanthipeptide synthase
LNTNDKDGVPAQQTVDAPAKICSELSGYVSQATFHLDKRPWELQIPALSLYQGYAGLALFFAAYYRARKNPQVRSIALETIAPVREWIDQAAANPKMQAGKFAIGGLIGIGSFIYALTSIADWLNASELFDSAATLTSMITADLILSDQILDVMKGCAGTLLALLSFIEISQTRGIVSQRMSELAAICGRHLVHSRMASGKGPRAWHNINGAPLPGFAYGITGICYSLMRLYEHTKQEELREAAFEGFAFERTLFVPEQQGWKDLRTNQIIERDCWCHGAPGIALGRLGCIAHMDEPAIRRDLEEALIISHSLPESSCDQLCCGNFGRIDILRQAGTTLDRLNLSQHARDLSTRVLLRAEQEGLRFTPPLHEQTAEESLELSTSLFLGRAGVGYTLLRSIYPELLPSILLLEAQV